MGFFDRLRGLFTSVDSKPERKRREREDEEEEEIEELIAIDII